MSSSLWTEQQSEEDSFFVLVLLLVVVVVLQKVFLIRERYLLKYIHWEENFVLLRAAR